MSPRPPGTGYDIRLNEVSRKSRDDNAPPGPHDIMYMRSTLTPPLSHTPFLSSSIPARRSVFVHPQARSLSQTLGFDSSFEMHWVGAYTCGSRISVSLSSSQPVEVAAFMKHIGVEGDSIISCILILQSTHLFKCNYTLMSGIPRLPSTCTEHDLLMDDCMCWGHIHTYCTLILHVYQPHQPTTATPAQASPSPSSPRQCSPPASPRPPHSLITLSGRHPSTPHTAHVYL